MKEWKKNTIFILLVLLLWLFTLEPSHGQSFSQDEYNKLEAFAVQQIKEHNPDLNAYSLGEHFYAMARCMGWVSYEGDKTTFWSALLVANPKEFYTTNMDLLSAFLQTQNMKYLMALDVSWPVFEVSLNAYSKLWGKRTTFQVEKEIRRQR